MMDMISSAIIKLLEHELVALEPAVQQFVMTQLQGAIGKVDDYLQEKLEGKSNA